MNRLPKWPSKLSREERAMVRASVGCPMCKAKIYQRCVGMAGKPAQLHYDRLHQFARKFNVALV